jgi:hypothetical protein
MGSLNTALGQLGELLLTRPAADILLVGVKVVPANLPPNVKVGMWTNPDHLLGAHLDYCVTVNEGFDQSVFDAVVRPQLQRKP